MMDIQPTDLCIVFGVVEVTMFILLIILRITKYELHEPS